MRFSAVRPAYGSVSSPRYDRKTPAPGNLCQERALYASFVSLLHAHIVAPESRQDNPQFQGICAGGAGPRRGDDTHLAAAFPTLRLQSGFLAPPPTPNLD
jgi:hypothetical protein